MFTTPFPNFTGTTITRDVLSIPSGLRYGGMHVSALRIEGSVPIRLLSPCTGWVNRKTSDDVRVLEFEALPLEFPAVLSALRVWPTIYVALPDTATTVDKGSITWTSEISAASPHFVFAILTPDNGAEDILDSLQWLSDAVGSVRGSRELSILLDAARRALGDDALILRDALGRPRRGTFTFVRDGVSSRLSTDDAGNLVSATTSRADLNGRRLSFADRLFTRDDGVSAMDEIEIVPGIRTISFTDLESWFSPQQTTALSRWTLGNTVVPFLNAEVFDEMFRELSRIGTRPEPGFHLTGYFISPDDVLTELPGIPATTRDSVNALIDAGGSARFLALDFFQLRSGAVSDLGDALMVLLVVLLAGAITIDLLVDEELLDTTTLMNLFLLIVGGVIAAGHLEELVETLGEPNRAAVDALTRAPDSIALFDPYPASSDDNPLKVTSLPSESVVNTVLTLMDRFNVFHQKIAVIRNDDGVHAYAGGVDLNPDRLDDFEHKISAPFKDVHARVDGPAVRDLALTFAERWTRASTEPLAISTPPYEDLPSAGNDVVQIARTYFAPNPDGSTAPFTFAPTGETTIYETTLSAIRNARQFIYVEDQHLTPPSEYVDEIVAAVDRGVEVFIMVPATPDQPFGFGPRSAFAGRIPTARVGVMRRGYSAIRTVRKADNGRLYLNEPLEERPSVSETVEVKPAARVPSPPFWMVVDKEIIQVVNKTDTTEDAVVRLQIRRGAATQFFGPDEGSEPDKHKTGAAATVVDFKGIHVHSSVMIVDDVFASIGSAAASRRGYFSDGECNIFAMPDRLRFTPNNWIRDLRTRLWSEALHIPEAVGRVLFRDPLHAIPWFERSRKKGNRFIDFATEATYPELFSGGGTSGPFLDVEGLGLGTAALSLVAAMILAAEEDAVFDIISDPSSYAEGS
ncbi:MAG: hypothetical protein AAGF12_00195 [Myxococcota bacterium]